ncbi:hypothetical protein FQR65_LT14085 [Abscondita terminalis]|nr:hypothetical protein FQR65_LT14085 [Abscondita terminalis]
MQLCIPLGLLFILLMTCNSNAQFIKNFVDSARSNFLTFLGTNGPSSTDLQCARPPASCPENIYRSIDGSCNNLAQPTWGAASTPYGRLLPPKYGDGISSAALAKSGNELPWPRSISLLLYPEVKIEDPKFTLAAMQFGQIMAHDMSLIAEPDTATQCCTEDGQTLQSQLPDGTNDPSSTDLQCARPPASCPENIYRSIDGSCNNLAQPTWGAASTPYGRLLPPKYGDGISSAALAKSGNELPWPRSISLLLYPEVKIEDPKFTLAAMQFGQIMAHDMSLIAEPDTATQCCTEDGQTLQSQLPDGCFPILLPEGDPQRKSTKRTCINFGRTLTTREVNCPDYPDKTDQVTIITHFLDLSLVYGSTDEVSQMLREFRGGRLRVDDKKFKEWPPQASDPSQSCPFTKSTAEACYMAGDVRVNQNPQLAILQVILLREHNRLAHVLSKLNPHWDDETLYQEARKINIAQYQHITYYEWLPIFIGVSNSYKNKVIFDHKGDFVNDYDPHVNPATLNEHATSTSRFYHSLIVGMLELLNKKREVLGSIRLSDWFNRPGIVEQEDNFDDLARGMITQPESKANQFVDSEVTQHLFRPPGETFGRDLKAADVARNRDHGLSSYNDYRALCGLPKAHSFDDFLDTISKEVGVERFCDKRFTINAVL